MKEKEYMVNMGFMDEGNGRLYSAGQTLTQIEYNMLPMNQKVRCSEKIQVGFDPHSDNFTSKP